MVAALDEARVERLIQKTISKGRSIGTLNFTLRNLLGKNKTLNIGKALEQKIGTKGFWNLVIGAGTPGALVDLLQDFDQEFCEEFLQAGRFQSQKQWEQVLDRGDFFQLCELVSKCDFLFATETGGERLAAAVRAVLNRLVVKSNWYQRRGGVAQLTNLPNSGMRDIVLNALDMWLEEREIDGLSFANLHETVDGIQLMYERRPDIRPELAKHLSTWLSSLKEWRLDPKRDMGLAQNLLGLSAHSEFSNQDAYVVVDAVVQRLTRDVMTKCRTQDLLWSIWKL